MILYRACQNHLGFVDPLNPFALGFHIDPVLCSTLTDQLPRRTKLMITKHYLAGVDGQTIDKKVKSNWLVNSVKYCEDVRKLQPWKCGSSIFGRFNRAPYGTIDPYALFTSSLALPSKLTRKT